MNKLIAGLAIATVALAGCGGGGSVEAGAVYGGQAPAPQAYYETMRYPTISGLEYLNRIDPGVSHLTDARGTYVGYSGGDTVTFVLGDMVLFSVPGDLTAPYGSLYDVADLAGSQLNSDTAVENLMAFMMAVDDDGDYRNGIQIAAPVRAAARGLRINFNQSAASFYYDSQVQYAVSILSGNTLYGTRALPSPAEAQIALRTP